MMEDQIHLARAKELYAQGKYADARKILEPLARKNDQAATMLSFLNTAQNIHRKLIWGGRGFGILVVLGMILGRIVRHAQD
jgi:hypothetical protein